MTHARISRSTRLTVALLLLVTAPVAQAQDRDAQCRYKVSNAARIYADYLLQRIATCHQWRMGGKLPATIDCNDPSTWNANGYGRGTYLMQRTAEKMTKIANSCRPYGGTPASVGYAACPAPCAVLPMTSFDDVAACMRCLVDDCGLAAAQQVNGTPPLPALHAERRCQQIIGRKLNAYLVKRAYLESVCQYNKENGKPGFVGLDCLDIDNPANTMHFVHQRALHDLTTLITNQCDPIDLTTELNMCGTDSASAIACLLAETTQCADGLFAAAFP